MTVSVIGAKTGYASATKTSAAVTLKAALQTLMPTPTITGTKTVGATLTAEAGTWDAGTTLTYPQLLSEAIGGRRAECAAPKKKFY